MSKRTNNPDHRESSDPHASPYRSPSRRRLARASLAVLLLGLAAIGAYLYVAHYGTEPVYAQDPLPLPPLEPGAARPWEAEIPVSTYCTLNTRTGNLLTAIPIVGWTGRGPSMSMALYHNAASVSSNPLSAGMGFDLGPGWSVSYSGIIDIDSPTSVTVIASDGTKDVYTWSDPDWIPPAGVHDILTQDGDTWRLTHKNQSYREYTQDGDVARLSKIVDATGNALTVGRVYPNPDRIDYVEAAGRVVEFIYDANDRLETILDPAELDEPPYSDESTLQDREWTFTYDANDRLDTITNPAGDHIYFDYHPSGRIIDISDLYSGVPPSYNTDYEFTYDANGRVDVVTDPEVSGTRLTQEFTLTATEDTITGTYTDRREDCGDPNCTNDWTYEYDATGNLSGIENPLNEWTSYEFDTNRNLTDFYYVSNERWVYTYDDRGNMLTSTDPLDQVQTWAYDAYNNVTSYEDAAGNVVDFYYEFENATCSASSPNAGYFCMRCLGGDNDGQPCAMDRHCPGAGACVPDNSKCGMCDGGPNIGGPCDDDNDCPDAHCLTGTCEVLSEPLYPTLMTRIVEPPDHPGNPEAETILDYYVDPDTDRCATGGGNGCGAIKEVIDPNGVWTGFEYDQWGQRLVYNEGSLSGTRAVSVFTEESKSNSAGEPVESGSSGSGETGCGGCEWRPRGIANVICEGCDRGGGDRQQAPEAPYIPNGPDLPEYYVNFQVPNPDTSGYSPKGELKAATIEGMKAGDTHVYTRNFTYAYDAYGRPTSTTIQSDEWNDEWRTFTYSYDTAAGQYTRTGPDGIETFVQLDLAGRVSHFERRPEGGSPLMTADYTYYTNGLVQRVEYSNNTSIYYEYDAALRLTSIDHRDILENTILKLSYEYTVNGLISRITETDNLGVAGWVEFAYDARGRLIKEVRTGEHPYNIAYEYDPGGNRTRKVQSLPGCDRIETVYYYDVEDPETYGSFNNRLMYYETFETCRVFEDYGHEGSCGTGGDAPVSTTWYYYDPSGNPVYILTELNKTKPEYAGTRLHYASNGRAVTFALGISWIKDNPAYNIDWAREFRYDGARQRYMNATLNPGDLESGSFNYDSTTWTDYGGDGVYGDFEMIGSAAIEVRSFEPGIGKFDWSGGSPAAGSVQFSHGNHISTTQFMTDSTGSRIDSTVYTAFGERIDGTNHRYGYAGAWGYQTHDDLPFLHVGHRYYDPATGRFLQRDPIGIAGGSNVYVYVRGTPTKAVDPSGLHDGGPSHWKKWPPIPSPPPRGTPPHPHLTEEGAELTLELTGGDESWLDDRELIEEVSWYLKVTGTCALWLTPYGRFIKAVHRALTLAAWAEEGHRREYF